MPFEVDDIAKGRLRNGSHRLYREKCLMTGNDNVRKRQEAREYVILDDLVGQVFEEGISFLFVDVQT